MATAMVNPKSLVFALCLASAAAAQIAPRPHVLLLYTDDQGYGDVSALNPEAKFRTPHMDRLVREGMAFTDAHSADTVCTPSRYALLTGRYAWRTRLKRGVMGSEGEGLIAPGRVTLASFLQSAGYRTAMVGKWHLGMRFGGEMGARDWTKPVEDGPADHGFDYFFGIPASMNFGVLTYIENRRVSAPATLWTSKKPNAIAIDDYRIAPPYSPTRAGWDLEVAPDFEDQEVLNRFTEKAVDWLESFADEAGAEDRFFLYVPYTSPHKPVIPALEYQGLSEAGAYGDFVMETDAHVGRLLEVLDRRGLTQDTLVVLTSDNGPETTYRARLRRYGHASAGPLKGGKRDLYEGGHRVPFVVRWPAVVQAGRRCDEPVGQVDLLATLADVLGAPLPSGAAEDSASILPALMSEEYPQPLRGPLVHHSGSGYFAVREGKWKLNMILGSGGSLSPRFVEPRPEELAPGEFPYELYDLESDLGETRNVAAEHPDVVRGLEREMTRIVRTGRSTAGPDSRNDGAPWWPGITWYPPER